VSDLLDKKNILFAGSLVEMGRAYGIVIRTGMKTELGVISEECKEAKEDTVEEKNPLKQKLDEFSEFLAKAILGVCIVIWVVNFGNFFDPIHGGVITGSLYYFKVAVALAVAAIPEGLPAVITTCLSLGTRRMTKKNAIIKKLPSVETLGCTTVICSDKTGTLTQNLMSVEKCFSFQNGPTEFVETDVVDTGYKVAGGQIMNNDLSNNFDQYKNMVSLTQAVVLGNATTFETDAYGQLKIVGNSTEAAIKTLGEKFARRMTCGKALGSGLSEYNDYLKSQWTNVATLEFSSARKTMSSLVRHKDSSSNIM
jgi:magnesium-transporting ATPase (P-type)